MTLDAEDKAWIRTTVSELVRGAPVGATILPRLTFVQFACAVELHADTIARKVREHQIPEKFVTEGRPMKISPAALELFNVTPQEAKARLAARNLLPPPLPSPESVTGKPSRQLPS